METANGEVTRENYALLDLPEGWKLRLCLAWLGLTFRPSYEGWKRRMSNWRNSFDRFLDLPMRDGNMFLPYHRRQFTFFRPSYEGWKLVLRVAPSIAS